MTQEDKQLLLVDLCGRLPYGVKIDIPDLFVSTKNNIEVLNEIFCGNDGEFRCNNSGMLIKHVKPYLFPLSSMTKEQIKEFNSITQKCSTYIGKSILLTDFCNKHHIDWRGFIEKGLALDATGLNVY